MSRAGLWLNGRKVVFPEGCRLLAIRDDDTVAPVALSEADLETLTKNFGALYDRALWEKVAPAFEPTKP